MGIFKISEEEKNAQLIYMICLWIGISILFIVVCFNDHRVEDLRGKAIVMEQLKEKNAVLSEQQLNVSHIDSLRFMLSQYNPENKQAYLESSISYELDELKKIYERKYKDPAYRLYMQINGFYNMLYFDKKATSNTLANNAFLKKNLEQCEIGFQQNQNNITLQEALQNNQEKE